MPEGPSLVILRELSSKFAGKKIIHAEGNSKAVDFGRLAGKKILSLRTFGKQFLIQLPDHALRIHFLLFGSYRIDERKENSTPRLSLGFKDGSELNFYACPVREIEQDLDAAYDWSADVMSPTWDAAKARKKLRAEPGMLACDALLDQDIFAGVGNIIKNEVLFRIRLHPLSTIGAMPAPKLRQMVEQARAYSFDFLEWKKQYELKKHWLAHARRICPRCDINFTKASLGRTKRRSFYCERCQKRYS